MDRESAFSFKLSKSPPFMLRMFLLLVVMMFGVYIGFLCLKQTTVQIESTNRSIVNEGAVTRCDILSSSSNETIFVHFPQPKTYSRGECACTPVQFVVILSMQRSGSGWFETLLNSHPNISSHGEIFSVKQRTSNISSILMTLDRVYSLEWNNSAAKNECVSAVGFKWMLNQAIMVYHRQIANYFNWKGVSVILLFRRNLLRKLVSVLANAYDKEMKQLNGTHKSHVHTKEEAEVLANFKPTLNTTSLIPNLSQVERIMVDSLQHFKSTRHIILYYEDIVNNPRALYNVQEFLKVPVRSLLSRQVKIHTRPLSEQIENWADVSTTLRGTQLSQWHKT
ncbi:hypothetical protein Sjap_002057 [Stephania japonica]|uniref:Sulfotransferase n=1 Tax=Stephania japonica TaxID=461633 RepID=A0AAP0KNE4_9MAGN